MTVPQFEYGVFNKWGLPPNGWFIMENSIKMMLWRVPLFQETSISMPRTDHGLVKLFLCLMEMFFACRHVEMPELNMIPHTVTHLSKFLCCIFVDSADVCWLYGVFLSHGSTPKYSFNGIFHDFPLWTNSFGYPHLRKLPYHIIWPHRSRATSSYPHDLWQVPRSQASESMEKHGWLNAGSAFDGKERSCLVLRSADLFNLQWGFMTFRISMDWLS